MPNAHEMWSASPAGMPPGRAPRCLLTVLQTALLCLALLVGTAGVCRAEARKVWEVSLTSGEVEPGVFSGFETSWASDGRGGIVVLIRSQTESRVTWLSASGRILYRSSVPVPSVFVQVGIEGISAATGLYLAAIKTEFGPVFRQTSTVWNISREGKKTPLPGISANAGNFDASPSLDRALVDDAGLFALHATPDATGKIYTVAIRRFTVGP